MAGSRIRIETDYIAVYDEEGRDEVIQIDRRGTFANIPLSRLSQEIDALLTDPFSWFERYPINEEGTTNEKATILDSK